MAGRGTDLRGTKMRAHNPPQDGPGRGRRRDATSRTRADAPAEPAARSHEGPGRTRRMRRAARLTEAREPRRLGPNTMVSTRLVAARHRTMRHASATRNRRGRGIAHVCGRNDTSRTTREPGRCRADETYCHGREAIESETRGRAGARARSAGTACSGAGVGLHRESGAPNGAAGTLAESGGPGQPLGWKQE